MIRPFHLAIPVTNLERSKIFYTNVLGCSLGRSSDMWIDLNFFNSAGDKTFNRISSASLSNENAFCGEAPFEVIYSAFLYVE